MFDNLREDWRTHDRQLLRQGLWVMAVYRFGRWRYKIRFRIDHFGGIIISGDAVFGDDCVVRNGVTVGLRHTGKSGSPVIGSRVDIGAGAKILGPIRIGDDVAIGANAVVLIDVPPNSIAVGVPARVLPRKSKTDEAAP